MAKFIESTVAIATFLILFCQNGFSIQVRQICFRLCKEHSNGFPIQTRQIFGAKSEFVKRECDCTQFQGNLRRRRSVNTSIQPTLSAFSNVSIAGVNTTAKPTEESKGIDDEFVFPSNIVILPGDADISNLNLTIQPGAEVPNSILERFFPLIKQEENGTKYCNFKLPDVKKRKMNESQIRAQNVNASFYKNSTWWVNVTWSPPKDAGFSDYLMYWNGGDTDEDTGDEVSRCRLVPKNVTFKVFGQADGWEYPNVLHVLIVVIPGYEYVQRYYIYDSFTPRLPPGIPITLEPGKVHEIQHGSIIAGVLAGILFIVVMLVLLYKRKSCGSSHPEHRIIIPSTDNALTKINNISKPRNIDTYFASYLPESEKYSTEVATIAYKLGIMGYKVNFDKVDSIRMNESGFNMWVDKQILEAKKYIVFCSPGYVKIWQSLASNTSVVNKFNHVSDQDLVRVRYEVKRISDVYSENCSTSRIVCIKMDTKMSTKFLPPWMNHNMLLWPEQKEDIIRRLNDQAAMVMHV